ncbi:transposase [Meiothermus ruber H328]|nr:transposase [Meiothermus ruber H328]
MGRMLDTLFEAGVTEVFLQIARFPVQALHVDSISFHVHGVYGGKDGG